MATAVAIPAGGEEPPVDAAADFDARVAEWERELADEAASAAWAIAADQAELAAEVAADPALAVALGWAADPHRDPWHADGGGPRRHDTPATATPAAATAAAGCTCPRCPGAAAMGPAERRPLAEELSDSALVQRVVELERQVAAVQAEQARAMVVLARRSVFRRADGDVPAATRQRVDTVEERCERAAYELSAALTVAPQTAANRLAVSLELVERMPATLAALEAGRLSWQRAKVLVTETRPLPPQARAAVERQALDEVDALTPGQLERKVKRWAIAADPRGAAERHAAARRQRNVRVIVLPDGMAELRAVLAADAAQLVATAVDAVAGSLRRQDDLDAAAAARPGSSGEHQAADARAGRRTADQLRADALATICADVLAAGHTGCARPACGDECTGRASGASERDRAAAAGRDGGAAAGPDRAAAAGRGRADAAGRDGKAAAGPHHASAAGTASTPARGSSLVPSSGAASSVPRQRPPVNDPPEVPPVIPPDPPPDDGEVEPRPAQPEPPMTPEPPAPPEEDALGADERGVRSGEPPAGVGAGQRRVRLARWHGHRPHVQVTVAATTLLGFDELPGYLAGYGPVTADQARRIAASGTWRRLLTDPASGRVLDYGRTRRDPPADLADFVIARDVTCRFPTSLVPAARCDLDHARPWFPDGRTDPDNVHAVSARAHQVRHDARWTVVPDPADGSLRWQSATGHRYRTAASQVGPVPTDRLLAGLPRWAVAKGGDGDSSSLEGAEGGRGAPGDIPPF